MRLLLAFILIAVAPYGAAAAPDALAQLVQENLLRLGCDPGAADGLWGSKSERALSEFTQRSGSFQNARRPSEELLDFLRSVDEPVCRSQCDIAMPTGRWEGTYHYGSSDNRRSVNFVFSITSDGNRFRGHVEEPATFGDGSSDKLYADVIGSTACGRQFGFKKQYDGTGGVGHAALYTGQLTEGLNTAAGYWRIGAGSGRFELRYVGN